MWVSMARMVLTGLSGSVMHFERSNRLDTVLYITILIKNIPFCLKRCDSFGTWTIWFTALCLSLETLQMLVFLIPGMAMFGVRHHKGYSPCSAV